MLVPNGGEMFALSSVRSYGKLATLCGSQPGCEHGWPFGPERAPVLLQNWMYPQDSTGGFRRGVTDPLGRLPGSSWPKRIEKLLYGQHEKL